MADKAKLSFLLLIVVILVSLSLAGAGFYLLNTEKAKNLELQGQLKDVNSRLKAAELKVRDKEKIISDQQFKLQETNSQVDALKSELEKELANREESLAKITILNTELEDQKKLRADLEGRLNKAQEDVVKTQSRIKELESQKSSLEAKINDLEIRYQGVELGKIVVSPETTPLEGEKTAKPSAEKKPVSKSKASGNLSGKVLVVNKEYDFVVINLGSKDKVAIGDIFSVYHNNQIIGDVKIDKLHDSMAAAVFLSADTKNKISEGDEVVQKGK
jgi:hypothetical protein